MGSHPYITASDFPTQGNYLGKDVAVCFHYDTGSQLKGVVVRDDSVDPGLMIIRLEDRRPRVSYCTIIVGRKRGEIWLGVLTGVSTPGSVIYMNTATGTMTHHYIVNVVDTDGNWHRIELDAPEASRVAATARRAAKAQGITVKYVNDFYIFNDGQAEHGRRWA